MKDIYFADFETTQYDEETNSVEVYLWCIVIGPWKKIGYTIESFIEYISHLKKSTIYFHNLKFDFSYIIHYLLTNKIDYEILEKKGVYYDVKLFNCRLRDTLNFFPNMTLKKVCELYASEDMQKGHIEHIAKKGHVATPEEIEYCAMDCLGLQDAYYNYMQTLNDVLVDAGAVKTASKLFQKITNASIAYSALKEMTQHFKSIFPKTTQAQYKFMLAAYKGGFVYSNKGSYGLTQMADNNSIYPFVYSTHDLPFGDPIVINKISDLEKYEFYIIKIYLKYDLKKGYIPIIGGGVGKFGNTVYKETSNHLYEVHTLCKSDWELIQEFYNVNYTFIEAWAFKTKKAIFNKFCQTFLAVKNQNKGAKRDVAKVLLNSPYGKLAMNGDSEIYKYYLNEKNITSKETTGYQTSEDSFQYLPGAIAITAGARRLLLESAKKIGFENIYYMDTDSIKWDGNIKAPFEFDPNILGMWKDEGLADYFKTLAPKKYVFYADGKIGLGCAGFNKKALGYKISGFNDIELIEDNGSFKCDKIIAKKAIKRFENGLKLEVLQSTLVVGGRSLQLIEKEIK